MADGTRPATGRELQAQIHAERRGIPFLAYRDEQGGHVLVELDPSAAPMTVGRRPDNDLALPWDSEVSRVHAQLEAVGHEWAVVDDGLSRNGSYVNGERVTGRRRLSDGDRLCFGETAIVFRAPAEDVVVVTTSIAAGPAGGMPLTEVQRRVLVGLCRPLGESAYAAPATNRAIAEEVHLSVDAVKAHLRVLFDRFGLAELPQNQKRARLAALALVHGVVHRHDL
jgi:pSer/pThr/pTyr-binding forkhead associated (FHA) protein